MLLLGFAASTWSSVSSFANTQSDSSVAGSNQPSDSGRPQNRAGYEYQRRRMSSSADCISAKRSILLWSISRTHRIEMSIYRSQEGQCPWPGTCRSSSQQIHRASVLHDAMCCAFDPRSRHEAVQDRHHAARSSHTEHPAFAEGAARLADRNMGKLK